MSIAPSIVDEGRAKPHHARSEEYTPTAVVVVPVTRLGRLKDQAFRSPVVNFIQV